MDRLTAMVAIAHARLRLRRILVLIEKYPHLLTEVIDMEIKRPMELAGLKSRLLRAQQQEKDIAVTGKRYDVVQDEIDNLHDVAKTDVGNLEVYAGDLKKTIERITGGSNGDPTVGQDGQNSTVQTIETASVGQVITSTTKQQ